MSGCVSWSGAFADIVVPLLGPVRYRVPRRAGPRPAPEHEAARSHVFDGDHDTARRPEEEHVAPSGSRVVAGSPVQPAGSAGRARRRPGANGTALGFFAVGG